jgi:TatD DNase family protein
VTAPDGADGGEEGTAAGGELTWIDSHCHVHDPQLPDGAAAAIAEARASGVRAIVDIGTDRGTSEQAIALAAEHDAVHATVGLHPHDARLGVDTILDLLDAPGVVAVGEAGLDYYYEHSPRDVQRRAFAEQIQLAHERSLPLVIHSRDAWDDTFDVLDAEGVPERTIFHCFTGGPDEARGCLDRGGDLSFSGIVTFKNAGDVRAAAVLCPLDRMLIETDSPYLAPTPHRGAPNRPAWVVHVGSFLAGLRGVPVATIAAATSRRASQLFGIEGAGATPSTG